MREGVQKAGEYAYIIFEWYLEVVGTLAQELELSAALKHQMLANLKKYTNKFHHM